VKIINDGGQQWRKHLAQLVARFVAAPMSDEVVLGGSNVRQLQALPPRCRGGANANVLRRRRPPLGRARPWPAAIATAGKSAALATPSRIGATKPAARRPARVAKAA
jgi:predicted NBD/HSP70 family sugar kinase